MAIISRIGERIGDINKITNHPPRLADNSEFRTERERRQKSFFRIRNFDFVVAPFSPVSFDPIPGTAGMLIGQINEAGNWTQT